MKSDRIVDKEYKEYIEKLPCHVCGFVPKGNRKIYNEFSDEYKLKPCRNEAHHVDTGMTRAKNDHRLLPVCAHYVVSGHGTSNCHAKKHSEAKYKTQEAREQDVKDADKYYEEYLKLKGGNKI